MDNTFTAGCWKLLATGNHVFVYSNVAKYLLQLVLTPVN